VITYAATANAGKLRELRAIFAGTPLRPTKPRKYDEVLETAETYEGNALLKAQALHNVLRARGVRARVLADDSGLEVAALDGRPGVLSARYGGPKLDWPQRRAALLSEMRGVPPFRRDAKFVCVLALVQPNGESIVARGEVEGILLDTERGTGGFGYDPLFLYLPLGRSFASLTEKEKNAVSHRRRAANALLAALRDRV
jgi:non-canonical purine NTP pyrophosphatase (RdgB/HAM1 family)